MATGGEQNPDAELKSNDGATQNENPPEQNHQPDVDRITQDLKGKVSLEKDDDSKQNIHAEVKEDQQDGGAVSGGRKKKKKKKKDKAGDAGNVAEGEKDETSQPLTIPKFRDFQKAVELFVHQGPARTMEDAKKKVYNFWDTQPVPKLGEEFDDSVNEPVEPPKDNIRQEPYSLPDQFTWDTLDIHDPRVLQELYTLLNENYVEDDDNMFRFDYSANFLLWALTPPGWLPQWHCGVRVRSNKKLCGFISAVPAKINIYDRTQKMVEINFLCVHKKLRSKRVAPVLIREITRRVNQENIFQAVFTAGVVLPKPLATCRYWHRSLNPKKLVDVKFSHIGRNMTLQRTIKLYRLPEETKSPGLRLIEEKDIPRCHQLLEDYLKKFKLSPVFSLDEFRHWFLPREGIIKTYVVQNGGGDEVTDFLSFYMLPSSIMHHPTHKLLKAAYSFYNVNTVTPFEVLMNDALILAKSHGFDVFNALDLMNNKDILEKLKFGIGDGNLQYYLYNWKCPQMKPEDIGLVLQ